MKSAMLEFRCWLEAEDPADWWKNPEDRGDEPEDDGRPDVPNAEGKVWTLNFSDAKRDPVEGYYYDLSKLTHPMFDITGRSGAKPGSTEDVNVGDQIADFSLNRTPYWRVEGVDPESRRVYVTPIGANPFVTGVGAGGKVLDQHDFDVHSGEYEKKRVDGILKGVSEKSHKDPSDVAYILLGTVPVNMGPNGSQGGWYSSGDTMSNRGGRKGMSAEQIQAADASTLVRLGFDVPPRALKGGLKTNVWDSFVGSNGNYNTPDKDEDQATYDDRLHGEDYADPRTMARFVLTHPQRAVRSRNASALIDYHMGRDRVPPGPLWRLEQEVMDAYHAGHYKRKELEPLLKQVAAKLAADVPDAAWDRHYLTKEKFIELAKREGWDDILSLFEKAADPNNRSRVFYHHSEREDLPSMFRMLDSEAGAENIAKYLSHLVRKSPQQAVAWRDKNSEKVDRALRDQTDAGYHARELKKVIDHIDNARDNPWFGKW